MMNLSNRKKDFSAGRLNHEKSENQQFMQQVMQQEILSFLNPMSKNNF